MSEGSRALKTLNPVREMVDGAWRDLDPELAKNSDGTWSPEVSLGGVRLSGDGNGPLVTMAAS